MGGQTPGGLQWIDWSLVSRAEAVLSLGRAVAVFKLEQEGTGQAGAVGWMWGMRKREGCLLTPGPLAVVSLDLEEGPPGGL